MKEGAWKVAGGCNRVLHQPVGRISPERRKKCEPKKVAGPKRAMEKVATKEPKTKAKKTPRKVACSYIPTICRVLILQ